jgi:uncharacterized membrane protein
MKRSLTVSISALALAALAACGNTTGERALTGGAIGAAGGAATGAIFGSPGTGAAIGGAAGAATGALTDREDLDLGDSPL